MLKPAQVREYRESDPLTNGLWRGRLLYTRLADIGFDVTGKAVLDVGCGYGGLALAATERGATVTGLDADPANIAVVARRAADAGAAVFPVVGSATALPLDDGRFDLATMIGVIEWLGYTRLDVDVRVQQVRALEELRRVLRRDGRLIVGTKNRLYPRYAWADAQLQKPLLNLLPRRLAERLSVRAYGTPYRAHVYSLRGWRRLFRDGGFAVEDVYVPLFTYQYPLVLARAWKRISPRAATAGQLPELAADVAAEALRERTPARRRYYEALGRAGLLGAGGGAFLFVCRPR